MLILGFLLFGVGCFLAGFFVCKNNYSTVVNVSNKIDKVKSDLK